MTFQRQKINNTTSKNVKNKKSKKLSCKSVREKAIEKNSLESIVDRFGVKRIIKHKDGSVTKVMNNGKRIKT